MNVALYEPRHHYWAMTERPRINLTRGGRSVGIGPSSIRCTDDAMEIDIKECGAPLPRRIDGTVRVTPMTSNSTVMSLDATGHHRWRPIAPQARVEVAFTTPAVKWKGTAYVDMNAGDEPLENAFDSWEWARLHSSSGTTILYDVIRRDGTTASTASAFAPDGTTSVPELPQLQPLPRTLWGLARNIRAIPNSTPKIIRTLEDTPFYARSLVSTNLGGGPLTCLHESLSLRRVANPIVRFMLPFRMPRWRYRTQT